MRTHAFRVLAAANFPKHRSLSDFRALHLQELATLFVQIVKLAGLARPQAVQHIEGALHVEPFINLDLVLRLGLGLGLGQ